MAVFIELTTSPIEREYRSLRDKYQDAGGGARAGRSRARRPTRGIEVKEDTYATLKVVKSDGSILPLLDSSAPDGVSTTSGTANFLLQAVQEQRVEKQQIIETFGASYIFFFGEQPRFLQVSAILLNTNDFNWEAEWWANYNTYLRGTKLVEMGARCYLAYDDNVVEGYMTQASATKTGMEPHTVQLQFQFFVTNCFNTSMVGDPRFPIRSSAVLPAGLDLRSKDSAAMLISNLAGEPLGLGEQRGLDDRGQNAERKSKLSRKERKALRQEDKDERQAERDERRAKRKDCKNAKKANRQQAREGDTSVFSGARVKAACEDHDESEGDGSLGEYSGLSEMLRNMPASFAVGADWWPYLASRAGAKMLALVTRHNNPIRSLIANNIDEFVGYFKNEPTGPYSLEGGRLQYTGETPLMRQTRTLQESDDLFRQATEMLTCFGANINSPRAYNALGLSANFSASASAGASFGASVRGYAGASFSASARVGIGAVAGGGYRTSSVSETRTGRSTSAFATSSTSFQSDSLGAVYGSSVTKTVTKDGTTTTKTKFGRRYQELNETGFDYGYGYDSAYENRPGFGKTGFGDFGGNGFGSGLSQGDPGFKDPDRFTFAGVADNPGAFERFTRRRNDNTALTTGRVAGRGELTGGASVEVSGHISAFALVSVAGTLDITGNTRDSPEFLSEQRRQNRSGFSMDNPYGVSCASPGPSRGVSFSPSAGFSARASASAGVSFRASARAGASASASASARAGFSL